MRRPLTITTEKRPGLRRAGPARRARVQRRTNADFDYAQYPTPMLRATRSRVVEHPGLRDAALVLGGASCVWRDLLVLETMIGQRWPGIVMVVNDIGVVWSRPLDHWATLHVEKFRGSGGWRERRKENGYTNGYVVWTPTTGSRRDKDPGVRTIRQWASGSSGLLAVSALYQLGAPRIVLCGVPMDDRPHFIESVVHNPRRRWTGVRAHRSSWIKSLERLRERTRSMSGWTRHELGMVTLSWLCGEAA